MSKKILIVEDEALVGLAMQETLRKHGYEIPEIIDSGDDIIPAIMAHQPDLILMDIRINSFTDGIDAAERIKLISNVPIIYISAFNDPATRKRVEKINPHAYLVKPVNEKTLIDAVRSVFA